MTKSRVTTLAAASLMLFSMFFGAGNLIFPPEVGANSGTNFWPAIGGFLLASVILPTLAIIAIAVSGNDVRDLASRGGWLFGLLFSVMAYLSIGAFYALPRTGATAMETAITPLTGWDGAGSSVAFNVIFFAVTLLLAWRPTTIVDTLGKFLTPALVALLFVLIAVAMVTGQRTPAAPMEDYAGHPMVTGLFEGYNTMDAISGLAFGIVVIAALRTKGFKPGKSMVRGTMLTSLFSGALLAVIYLGLAYVAQTVEGSQDYNSGAALLADSAHLTMGTVGQVAFSAIVILACLTTSVGLLTATGEFFAALVPKVNYHYWAVGFTILSLVLAIQGLDTVLLVAVPIITFLYPPAITLIILTVLNPRNNLRYAYRFALWTAVAWSALTVAWDPQWLSVSPGQALGVGWFVPTLIAALIGVAVDFARPVQQEPQSV
ncbi:branched-chain amino acid transport system II carrier protein [Corynebacterium massiliense]|uniref:Branched-chain amino acid transport system 2 carrier protein n=1 Tax=Corynebacterium massiliense DSM 45435 TaxID=1121364 RepID=A0ABY7U8E2_9CORY|nr:branched-chain amino acid transport system II carrier protein [Corynebacterium massiliense]WCZ32975.1 Branched-chain amino acid transport system 2 carrier protein [Corynebacterium massiliense DSM 45435]